MGRKSKKSMANKLAKMGDEERAKYFQRKADAEEEAKRRRQQLIAIFLKNKIRKEECFSRLNLAKINQNWHQILRRNKCKQMKDEVLSLRKWMATVYSLKNKTIEHLLDELEDTEQQFQNNFQSHVLYMDTITERHNKHLKDIQNTFENDRNDLVIGILNEKEEILMRSFENIKFLKMLLFGGCQETEIVLKGNKEKYCNKMSNLMANYTIDFELMEDKLKRVSLYSAEQISKLVKNFIKKGDLNRSHYQKLLNFDSSCINGIYDDLERINQERELLKRATNELTEIKETREKKINNEEKKAVLLKQKLTSLRKLLCSTVKRDEKKINLLIECSNDAIKYYEDIFRKGEILQKLMQNCQKFESKIEEIRRWSVKNEKKFDYESDLSVITTMSQEEIVSDDKNDKRKLSLPDIEKESQFVLSSLSSKPKSAPGSLKSLKSDQKFKIHSEQSNEFNVLKEMDKFWVVYNETKIHLLQLKREKRDLLSENITLKKKVKDYLLIHELYSQIN